MRLPINLHKDYKLWTANYQIKLPFDIELSVPADDPVRLLSAFVEGMDLSELYATYDRIRKNQATPRQMLKIMIYAAMNRIYSSRDIEKACRRDINFLYLLEGAPAPDHATIARFMSLHFSACSRSFLAEVTSLLYELGEVSANTVFIDGTKIEAYANKYTFVWKRTTLKSQKKLFEKILLFTAECERTYGLRIVYNNEVSEHTLLRLKKDLLKVRASEGIRFVHGTGKKKSTLQKDVEQLDEFRKKLHEYNEKLRICGNRNSYSKTDHDATFMRLKEDAMLNGQLKPAYNVQHAVDAEYITWVGVSEHPTDTLTLIPLLKEMEKELPFKYSEIVADAGYESEENYAYLERNGQRAFIKPANYEISKTRKYREDPGRRENMAYDADRDCYLCRDGRELAVKKTKTEKTRSGYCRTVTIYECKDCRNCPYKTQCIRGNNSKTPMEDRNKVIYVSKAMKQYQAACLERITSDYGTMLRMNRSIQAEGSFAVIKEDMGFRQYLYRGKKSVLAQSILTAIAHNINRLHFKIQGNRTRRYLIPVLETA